MFTAACPRAAAVLPHGGAAVLPHSPPASSPTAPGAAAQSKRARHGGESAAAVRVVAVEVARSPAPLRGLGLPWSVITEVLEQALAAAHGELDELRCRQRFTHTAPFDTQGVLYHIATDGLTKPWCNPHEAGLVVAASSSRHVGKLSHFVLRPGVAPARVHNFTQNLADSWVSVDLGESRTLKLDHYSLRADLGVDNAVGVLRHWQLQAATDAAGAWTVLKNHANDKALRSSQEHSVASWPVEASKVFFRHFRVLQTGINSARTYHLAGAGIELYGELRTALTPTPPE